MAAITNSLTHVCKWTSSGWVHTTADEIAYEHPEGSISGHSGLFMCDLCKQPVSYIHRHDGTNYFDHFKPESKNCPEHSDRKCTVSYKASEYSLPVRIINRTGNDFEFELGFPPISKEILEKYRFEKLEISAQNPFERVEYTFERLNINNITYVSIGRYPYEEYIIKSPRELYWPYRVSGMSDNGTLFDTITGRRLVNDADVLVGKSYYLLLKKHIDNGYSDVRISYVSKISEWNLYKVTAISFTRTAANFFLKYWCKLTNSPIVIQPIWPVYIQSPYLIRNAGDITWVYVYGRKEIVTKAYPTAQILKYPSDEGTVYSIEINEKQEVISTGYTNAIEYVYLWKDLLIKRQECPTVSITDINGNPVPSGLQNIIPQNHIIRVTAPFDGTIRLEKNGFVIEQISLKAEISIELDAIQYGVRVLILQGLDIVWSAEYKKENSEVLSSDDTVNFQNLVHAHGRKIPVSHTLGVTVILLKNYPKTRKWISEKIRSGYMEEDALAYYKNFIVMLKSKR